MSASLFAAIPNRLRAFTLIELLIVVAIIAILAAIAVPNFLEAQTRAKVSRVQSDLRSLATGLEAYRVDHQKYPEGTDNPDKYPLYIGEALQNVNGQDLRGGYYTLATRAGTEKTAGRDFHTLTTPIAYTTEFFTDPFANTTTGFLTYCYRPDKDNGSGYILTSFGPDSDVFSSEGGPGVGTFNPNPLSTFSDTKVPARMGDINERAYIHAIMGEWASIAGGQAALDPYGNLRAALDDLSYDPTNGTSSDGDIYRVGP